MTRTTLMVAALMAAAPLSAQQVGSAPPAELADLPLVVRPVSGASDLIALVMSGDGNWAPFVDGLGKALVRQSIPVVGLESRAYLRHPRSPEEVARDMQRVLGYYVRAWSARRILVVGYSRGADFAPFVANLAPPELRDRIVGVGLFSPSLMASFEFHLSDLVRYSHRSTDVPLTPQIEALETLPVLCVYGVRDPTSLCPRLDADLATIVALDAGHKLGDPAANVALLLRTLGLPVTGPTPPHDPAGGGHPGSDLPPVW